MGGAPGPHAANTPKPRKLTPAAEFAFSVAHTLLSVAVKDAQRECEVIRALSGHVMRRAREGHVSSRDRVLLLLAQEQAATGWRWFRLETARRAAAEAAGWRGTEGTTDAWLRDHGAYYPPPALEAPAQPPVVLTVA